MSSVPGLGTSPGEENGNPLQYTCLENSMDRGAQRATVHGVTKSQTQLNTTQQNMKYVLLHIIIYFNIQYTSVINFSKEKISWSPVHKFFFFFDVLKNNEELPVQRKTKQILDLRSRTDFDGTLHIIHSCWITVCCWTNMLYSIVGIALKHNVNTSWEIFMLKLGMPNHTL